MLLQVSEPLYCVFHNSYIRCASEQVYYIRKATFGAGFVMQASKCISLHIIHYFKLGQGIVGKKSLLIDNLAL